MICALPEQTAPRDLTIVTEPFAEKSCESGDAASSTGTANGNPSGALDPLLANLAEIEEYLSNYVAAQKDGLIAAVRRVILVAAAAITLGVIVLAFVGGATVLLLDGLANAVASADGGRIWVGEIVIGSGAILVVAAAGLFGARYWLRLTSRETKRKYEQRHKTQRSRFGRSDAEQAVR